MRIQGFVRSTEPGGYSHATDHTFVLTWSIAVTADDTSENFGA